MKIHKTAIIHPKAQLAKNVSVGPFSVVEEHVSIGEGTEIGQSCRIEGHTTLGKNCKIFTGSVIGSPPQDLKYKGDKSFVIIGDNNIIREYNTVNPGTEEGGRTVIGDGNLLMAYTHVAHDCRIGNNCIIANVGTLAGYVTIEDYAVVGGIVAIHQFCRVGKLSIIGGCSKVVQDIPPYSTCDGHPTKVFGLNLVGLRRAKVSREVIRNLKEAFKLLFNSGLTISHAVEKINKEIPKGDELNYLVEFVTSSKRGICRR
ncbi:acyl-ACP--UDP-N-acetylglucosamine O-acyltransferase [Candidatus Omnitrophota bacterium]